MQSRIVTVTNPLGLHARPAAAFVTCAQRFRCDVLVGRPAELAFANAKSIMAVLTLDVGRGEQLEIVAEGPDEAEAADALAELVAGGFAGA